MNKVGCFLNFFFWNILFFVLIKIFNDKNFFYLKFNISNT
jgi:hypothetical protein